MPLPTGTTHQALFRRLVTRDDGKAMPFGARLRAATIALGVTMVLAVGLLAAPGQTLTAEAAKQSISLNGVSGSWSSGYQTVIWGKAKATNPTTRWVRVQRKKGSGKWKTVQTVQVTNGQAWNWQARVNVPAKAGQYKFRVRLLSSRKGKVLKTSKTKTVQVKAAPRIFRAITGNASSAWTPWTFPDADPNWDALSRDADGNGQAEMIYYDSDRYSNHTRWDVYAWNSVGWDGYLENIMVDRNYDGVYDMWVWDTDQRQGLDYYLMDNNYDKYWDSGPLLVAANTEPIGILGQMGAASIGANGYFESCGRTNCQRPGL